MKGKLDEQQIRNEFVREVVLDHIEKTISVMPEKALKEWFDGIFLKGTFEDIMANKSEENYQQFLEHFYG